MCGILGTPWCFHWTWKFSSTYGSPFIKPFMGTVRVRLSKSDLANPMTDVMQARDQLSSQALGEWGLIGLLCSCIKTPSNPLPSALLLFHPLTPPIPSPASPDHPNSPLRLFGHDSFCSKRFFFSVLLCCLWTSTNAPQSCFNEKKIDPLVCFSYFVLVLQLHVFQILREFLIKKFRLNRKSLSFMN